MCSSFTLEPPELQEYATVCAMHANETPERVLEGLYRNVAAYTAAARQASVQECDSDFLPDALLNLVECVCRVEHLPVSGSDSEAVHELVRRTLAYLHTTLGIDKVSWRQFRPEGRFSIAADHRVRAGLMSEASAMLSAGFRLDTALGLLPHPGDSYCYAKGYAETCTEDDFDAHVDGAAWTVCDLLTVAYRYVYNVCMNSDINMHRVDVDLSMLLSAAHRACHTMPWTRFDMKYRSNLLEMVLGLPLTMEVIYNCYPTVVSRPRTHCVAAR